MRPRQAALSLLASALSLALASCRCTERAGGAPETKLSVARDSLHRVAEPEQRRSDQPFDRAALCKVGHGGMFLDLGTDASHARRSFLLGPFSDVASDTWSDQSYTRFMSRSAHYDFWSEEPLDDFELRVRAKGGTSQRLTVRIDGTSVGTARVSSTAFQTSSFSGPKQPLGPGRHQVELRWWGRGAGDGRPHGMVEWLHWSLPGHDARHYRAPRQRSLRDDVVLGDEPRRALLLEAPSTLACPVRVTRNTELVFGIGARGESDAVAQVFARRDGAPPRLLAERRVAASAQAWTDVSLDLDALSPHLVELELRAAGAPGARLAVSEPRVVARTKRIAAARAKLAVLVVASGLHRELLPPFSGTRRLRHVAELARSSARFTEYRVPTSVVGGVVTSLLSGLPPRAHGFESPKSRLPASVQTLADRLREISGESALWTGVPQTRPVFGFERGWTVYEAFSPVNDVPAAAPLSHARTWLERALQRDPEAPRLLVIHVRGGHPPWDLSREEASELEPREYGGLLEARRGGIILGTIRRHFRLAQRRLSASDWVRLRALQLAALAKQDEALGALIELLQRTGMWEHTLFALTGDVASGDPPEAPFGDARALTEDRLLVPLWIKFPGARHAGAAVSGPATSIDVAATLAHALGVRWPKALGEDLHALARGGGPVLGRPFLATLGQHYATRWGPWLLRGSSPKTPVLCELNVDPACVHDVLAESPLAAQALWRATFDGYQRQREIDGSAHGAEVAEIDRDTAAALRVWGE